MLKTPKAGGLVGNESGEYLVRCGRCGTMMHLSFCDGPAHAGSRLQVRGWLAVKDEDGVRKWMCRPCVNETLWGD